MQRPSADDDDPNCSEAGHDSALQVLAVAASNHDRYLGGPSSQFQLESNGALNGKQGHKATKANGDAKESGVDSSSSCSSGSDRIRKWTSLRGGKWLAEEEEYATRLILYLSTGVLNLPEGKSIRAYLAEKLQCDPMRITKKYVGAGCLGYPVSRMCGRCGFSPRYVEMANSEIARLERRFQMRLTLGPRVLLPPESVEPLSANSNDAPLFLPQVIVDRNSGIINDQYHVSPQFVTTNAQSASVIRQAEYSTAETQSLSVSSRLEARWNNARIAASSSLSSNSAPVLVQVPHSVPPPSLDAQKPLMPHQSRQQQMFQAPLPAMSLAIILENISQVLANRAARSCVSSSGSALAAVDKDGIMKTILLQIMPQLEALATLSTTALLQILLQILEATLPSHPATPAASQRPIYSRELPKPLVASSGVNVATLLANIQLATAGQLSTRLQTLLPTKILAHDAQTDLPLSDLYQINSLGVAPKNGLANPPFIQPLGTPHAQVPVDQSEMQRILKSALAQKASRTPSNTLPSVTGNNIAELVRGLLQEHDKPLERKKCEQCWQFCRRNVDAPSEGGCTFRQRTPQLTSNLINTTCTERGPATKRQKVGTKH